MRTDYIRIYKSVHTWTGILSGMALFIAFYAGALTVFKEPLTRWASPPVAVERTALADTPALIAATLAAHPEAAKGFTIHLDPAENMPARLSWDVRAPQADDHDDTATRHYTARLDAEGRAQASELQPAPLAGFIDTLHRVVGLPFDNDPNRWVMGVIATLYALALFSGVVVLLPTLVKDFFALRVGRNLKRMWLDAHNVVGIVSLPFHIVMALTAAVFAFHDGIYDVQDHLVHGGQWSTAFQRPPPKAGNAPPRDPAAMLPPAELAARARALSPGFIPTGLQYQGVTGPRATVRVWGKHTQAVLPRAVGGFAALDPYSGKVLSTDFMPGRQGTPGLFISSFFALHMAAFGGALVQWLYFLLGLAGAWLFYSGNLLWIESRRKRAAPQQRRDTRYLASATVGVCLGCICGISLLLPASKWLHGHVDDLLGALQAVYYAAFFGCIAWAFARGAARAAVHLLWLACACTLLAPATTLLGWLLPATGLWAHRSPATLGVDGTALALALCLALMARATARRMGDAVTDSVWSAARGNGIASGNQLNQIN
ncbi:MAG: PepSY-associated TM helix domain-containing protein [Acidovorax sp.]